MASSTILLVLHVKHCVLGEIMNIYVEYNMYYLYVFPLHRDILLLAPLPVFTEFEKIFCCMNYSRGELTFVFPQLLCCYSPFK